MGEEAKIRKLIMYAWIRLAVLVIIAFTALMLIGCDVPKVYIQPPPSPTIKVTVWKEGSTQAGVRVEYFHHHIPTNNDRRPLGYTVVDFKDSQSVKAYREQIEAMDRELKIVEDHLISIEEKAKKDQIIETK